MVELVDSPRLRLGRGEADHPRTGRGNVDHLKTGRGNVDHLELAALRWDQG